MTIYVVDVNDNAPSFVNLPYSVDIAEVRHVTWSRGGPWGGGGRHKGGVSCGTESTVGGNNGYPDKNNILWGRWLLRRYV